ncbi:MAG: 2-Phospho-l-lactate Guanylyltransferase,CofC [Hydrocarboniphaga sp.]|uniref:2-phospho-L-lactate guanylyltransferase n=1 Tax=Hydrocarboniphaga sp. TaxID=2033016 RepID=UPI00260DC2E2|nr:2-phospho-L-lactate guanylyltransferase [Hydrocarboniphaga sp.]MDB5968629.1 2-Phospho-l-lactate Guanylyltransferase,CofC [Hydrocarboniphaga sp.]
MWAVVPLKSPERAKTRLAGMLSPAQRRQLLFVLAERVIRALQATRGVDEVAIVTASTEVATFAAGLGARTIMQPAETGTAAAFAAAVQALRPQRLPQLLMIAGDLPLVSTPALERLVTAGSAGPGVVVVPDRHFVGTNALLCSPPQSLTPCFGSDSFRRHLAAARAAGLQTQVLPIEALSLDLDYPEDLVELRRRCGAAADTLFALMRDIEAETFRHDEQRRLAVAG